MFPRGERFGASGGKEETGEALEAQGSYFFEGEPSAAARPNLDMSIRFVCYAFRSGEI